MKLINKYVPRNYDIQYLISDNSNNRSIPIENNNIQYYINKDNFTSLLTGKTYSTINLLINADLKNINKLNEFYKVKDDKNIDTNIKYSIPYIKEKEITLTNAGKSSGAKLSTNLLDSIAKYANRAGLPIYTALGLAAKESTLGNPTHDYKLLAKLIPHYKTTIKVMKKSNKDLTPNQQINNGRDVDPEELVNYHAGHRNPYSEALLYAYDHSDSNIEFNNKLLNGINYANFLYKKLNDLPKSNILEDAFRLYKNNPKHYNYNLKNYVDLVNERTKELLNSPEILKWLKNR